MNPIKRIKELEETVAIQSVEIAKLQELVSYLGTLAEMNTAQWDLQQECNGIVTDFVKETRKNMKFSDN